MPREESFAYSGWQGLSLPDGKEETPNLVTFPNEPEAIISAIQREAIPCHNFLT
jgi:hypothetical protein